MNAVSMDCCHWGQHQRNSMTFTLLSWCVFVLRALLLLAVLHPLDSFRMACRRPSSDCTRIPQRLLIIDVNHVQVMTLTQRMLSVGRHRGCARWTLQPFLKGGEGIMRSSDSESCSYPVREPCSHQTQPKVNFSRLFKKFPASLAFSLFFRFVPFIGLS
jgi:hypothetical protein